MFDEYAQLKKIIADTITTLATTQTFNVNLFLNQMEGAFKSAGFRETETNSSTKSILLVNVGAAGDFVLTTPAIRAVRENFPKAHIVLIVNENIFKLAELCPYVNEVLTLNKARTVDYIKIIIEAANFSAAHLWQRHFDLAICLGTVTNLLKNFLTYLSGARQRVSYLINDLDKIFNTHYYRLSERYNTHEVIISLYLLKAHGLKIGSTDIEVWFNNSDLYTARRLLQNFGEGRIKVAVGIGANSPARKYPIEKYLEAFKVLIDKGASLVIFGGQTEIDAAKFLEENLPKEFVKNFVELKAGWRVDVAAMSLTDMYIGNFTGACDIAAALKKPVVGLSRVARDIKKFFVGLNEAERYRPWGTNAIILQPEHQLEDCVKNITFQGCTVGKSHCIAKIEPTEIVYAFDKIIDFIQKNSSR